MDTRMTNILLTDAEREVAHLITELLTEGDGMDMPTATEHAIKALPNPRPEFVLWVSGGTLALVGNQTYRVADLEGSL
jgi:hypothetical protein